MPAPNKYFDAPVPPPVHPRVRAWRSYRREPQVHHVVVEVRQERDGLVALPARLFVDFCREDGGVVRQDEAPWEFELENWLVDEEKAPAITPDNEKLRFALLLKPALRPALVRFGDGYFNAVLVASLRAGPFGKHPEVAAMLAAIHENKPADGSRLECEQMIDAAFSHAAHRLLTLHPDRDEAADILGGAIARYLDTRFSISNSRDLGLL